MRDRLIGRIDDQYEIMLVSDSCKGHIMKHAIQFMTDTGGDLTFMQQTRYGYIVGEHTKIHGTESNPQTYRNVFICNLSRKRIR